jgi:hypothetical protein
MFYFCLQAKRKFSIGLLFSRPLESSNFGAGLEFLLRQQYTAYDLLALGHLTHSEVRFREDWKVQTGALDSSPRVSDLGKVE